MQALTLRDWLASSPFTLTLSSGFFGFFAHAGMLEVLVERGLRPRRITGSSAGALVGGLYAAGLEPAEIAAELLRARRADFWDPRPGLGLLRGARFRLALEKIVGDARLEATRVPAQLVVHDVLAHRPVALSSGSVARAIQASCAVPFLFQPVIIDHRPYLDGGILDRPGTTPLAPDERALLHHLESRSPWRVTLSAPERARSTTLTLGVLPRSGPFKLEAGALAYERAKSATTLALALPWAPVVRVR
jgi:NTE family protein